MNNKLIKTIALSLLTASLSSAVFANLEPLISTQDGCEVANNKFESVLITAHKDNKLLNVKVDTSKPSGIANDVCFANLVYGVETEIEAMELHAQVQDYVAKSTAYTIPDTPKMTKIN